MSSYKFNEIKTTDKNDFKIKNANICGMSKNTIYKGDKIAHGVCFARDLDNKENKHKNIIDTKIDLLFLNN